MNSILRTAIATSSVLFLVHCGGSNSEPPKQPTEVVETSETTTTETTTPATTPQGGTAPAGTSEQGQGPSSMNSGSMNSGGMGDQHMHQGASGTTQTTGGSDMNRSSLSDGQIVAVIAAANQGELELAEVAKKNANSARVKTFATTMITDHGNSESKGKAVIRTTTIRPVESDTSRRLKADADTTVSMLRVQKGKTFDTSYVDAQVKYHREVLATIDDELLPNVTNPQLKAHLEDLRRSVASHLAKAEELEKKVETP